MADYISDGNNAALVRLIKQGAVFLFEKGTLSAPPTDATWEPTEGDKERYLGYYGDGGAQLNPSPGDTTDFSAHNADVVLSETAPGWWEFVLSALEANKVAVPAYFDIDSTGVDGETKLTVKGASNNRHYEMIVAGLDQAGRKIIGYFHDVKIGSKEGVTLNTTTLMAYGMTFRTFPDSSGTHFEAWGFIAPEGESPVDPPAEESSSSSSAG